MEQNLAEMLDRLNKIFPVIERQIRDGRRLLSELDHDPLWSGRPDSFEMTEASISLEELEGIVENFRANLDALSESLQVAYEAKEMTPVGMDELPESILSPMKTVIDGGEQVIYLLSRQYPFLLDFVNKLRATQGKSALSEISSELN